MSVIKNTSPVPAILYLLILPLLFVLSSCKEEEEAVPVHETSTMMDIESNVYSTIKIGNKWWMAEDLRVTTFRNGISIRNGQDTTEWKDTSAAFCLFENNPSAPGLLYNWYAVTSDNGLAPEGWHIATDEEWKELEIALGMSSSEAAKFGWRGTSEGNKMKLEGTSGWQQFEDNWPDNASGFSAAAGGCRLPNARWGAPALFATGFWWTATEKDPQQAFYRYLDYKSAKVFRSADSRQYGFSIRCVKN